MKNQVAAATAKINSDLGVTPKDLEHKDKKQTAVVPNTATDSSAPANKDQPPAADDELSRTSTQSSASTTPLPTPKGETSNESIPAPAETVSPLPAPLDVDAIELPCRDPNALPHWERESEQSPNSAPARRWSTA
jgi:hypothetical protein